MRTNIQILILLLLSFFAVDLEGSSREVLGVGEVGASIIEGSSTGGKLWTNIDEQLSDFRGKIGTYYDVNVTYKASRERVGVSVMDGDILELHLNIPEKLQGQGIGTKIVQQAVAEDTPRAIKGWWKKQDIYTEGESLNLTIFKNKKAENLSDIEAALQTPSGKIFSREGFDNVQIIKNTEDEVIIHFTQSN